MSYLRRCGAVSLLLGLMAILMPVTSAAGLFPTALLPSDLALYVRFDISAFSPSFKTYISEFLKDELVYDVVDTSDKVAKNFVATHLLKGPAHIAFFVTREGELAPVFLLETTESSFENDLKKPFLAFSGLGESYLDYAFTYKDGYAIVVEGQEILDSFLTPASSLEGNAEFAKVTKELAAGAGVTFYGSATFLEALLDEEEFEDMFPAQFMMVKAFGASLHNTSSTQFTLDAYSILDEAAVKEAGLDYGTPMVSSLQKYLPSGAPLFSMTRAPISGFGSVLNTLLQSGAGFDLSSSLSLFDNEIALVVQDQGRLEPAVTLLIDVKNEKEQAAAVIKQLLAINMSDFDLSKKEKITLDGATLDRLVFSMTDFVSENPYAFSFAKDATSLYLTVGITNDNVLLISSMKNITNAYGDGLTLTSAPLSMSMSYSSAQLAKYFSTLSGLYQKAVFPEFAEDIQLFEMLGEVARHTGSFNATGVTTNTGSKSQITFSVDVEPLVDSVAQLGSLFFQSMLDLSRFANDFDDVKKDAWYSEAVYYLYVKGIVDMGYYGVYHPSGEVNRAQFVKLLVEMLAEKGHELPWGEAGFSDTVEYDWFSPPLNKAVAAGLIKGYGDNTFRPAKPVTRAEAVQIVANVLQKFAQNSADGAGEPAFKDVKKSDWFFEAVRQVYQMKLVQGRSETQFVPHDTLNRAEAAILIRKLMGIL